VLKRPLLPVGIAFAAGIVLSGVFGVPLAVAMVGLVFGCAFAAARRAFGIALLFLVAAAGALRYEVHTAIPPDDVSRFLRARTSAVVGRVASDVDLRDDRALFPLAVRAVEVAGRLVPASGKLMVIYYRPRGTPDWRPPDYGDVLLIRSGLSRPSGPSNPGDFSWRDYLARQRIHAVSYVRSPRQGERLASDAPSPLVVLALRAKRRLADSVAAALPPDEAAVVTSMALGSYVGLPARLLSNFTRTGTLHLLAASGFNCAVLIAVFGFVLVRLGKQPRKQAHPALILILVFYMLMVGAKPSIVRATVMATLMLLGVLVNRPGDVLNLLFAAAIVILAINPADIFDVSFQLSFAAVLALITALPVIQEVSKPWGANLQVRWRRLGWLSRAAVFTVKDAWQAFTATAAATLGTLPLSAHYFNQFSLVSIAVNAIVAAAVLPIFAVGLLLPVFSSVPGIGDSLSFVGTNVTRLALSAINWFGELPHSCLSVPSPGAVGIIGYYVLLAVGLRYAYSRIAGRKRAGGS